MFHFILNLIFYSSYIAQAFPNNPERLHRRELFLSPGFNGDFTIRFNPTGSLQTSLGDFRLLITTEDEELQNTFNTGLLLLFNFNHFEAAKWFLTCTDHAMCNWGLSWAYGPYLNKPFISEDDYNNAKSYAEVAVSKKSGLSDLENVLIDANQIRYSEPTIDDALKSYTNFMNQMASLWSGDWANNDLIGVHYVASMITVNNYAHGAFPLGGSWFDEEGNLLGNYPQILEVLETILDRSNHPQAEHFYIHMTEAMPAGPGGTFKGLQSGYDLVEMFGHSDAGHLVHMPSHIFLRCGKWNDVIISSAHARVADDRYLASDSYAYVPMHNRAFAMIASTFTGQLTVLEEFSGYIQDLCRAIPDYQNFDIPIFEAAFNLVLEGYVKLRQWEKILNYEVSYDDIPQYAHWVYPEIVKQYALGMAYLHVGTSAQAQTSYDNIVELISSVSDSLKSQADMLQLTLGSAIAYKNGEVESAILLQDEAVTIAKGLPYMEPPPYPVTTCLGQIYLDQGRYYDAKETFELELTQYYDNPFALRGSIDAMKGMGTYDQTIIDDYESRFTEHWSFSESSISMQTACDEFHFPTCKGWCSSDKMADRTWAQKCGFKNCQGCSQCDDPANTPNDTCKPWCARKPQDWSKKCNWENCQGCAECS